jgi:hypothetical protein
VQRSIKWSGVEKIKLANRNSIWRTKFALARAEILQRGSKYLNQAEIPRFRPRYSAPGRHNARWAGIPSRGAAWAGIHRARPALAGWAGVPPRPAWAAAPPRQACAARLGRLPRARPTQPGWATLAQEAGIAPGWAALAPGRQCAPGWAATAPAGPALLHAASTTRVGQVHPRMGRDRPQQAGITPSWPGSPLQAKCPPGPALTREGRDKSRKGRNTTSEGRNSLYGTCSVVGPR